MAGRRYPPNRRLAWERLQRGWSYEEITEHIRAEMSRAGETDTGLNANTVRRWEIGERWPDPRYRKHLVAILGKPASDLGLLTPDELAVRPDAETLHEFRRLWEMLTGDDNSNGWDRASVLRALVECFGDFRWLPRLLSQRANTSETGQILRQADAVGVLACPTLAPSLQGQVVVPRRYQRSVRPEH